MYRCRCLLIEKNPFLTIWQCTKEASLIYCLTATTALETYSLACVLASSKLFLLKGPEHIIPYHSLSLKKYLSNGLNLRGNTKTPYDKIN